MPSNLDRLAEDLLTVKRVAPSATPGLVYGLAQTADPLISAQATQGLSEANLLKSALERLDAKHQLSSWATLDGNKQRLLSQLGYIPPNLQPENRGWFDQVQEVAGNLATTAGGALAGAVAGGLIASGFGAPVGLALLAGAAVGTARGAQLATQDKSIFSGLSWTTDDFLHAYRAMGIVTREAGERGQSSWSPWTWTQGEWGKAWEEAGDDFLDFSVEPEEALRQFNVVVAPSRLPIIADIARGTSDFDLLQKYGQDALEDAQQDANFERAVETIQSFGLSPGRQLAHGLGISRLAPPGTTVSILGKEISPFDFYSGLGDGLVRWYGDPLNVGFGGIRLGVKGAEKLALARGIDITTTEGKQAVQALSRQRAGFNLYRRERALAKYGISNAEDVRRVSAFPETQRAYRRIAEHFAEGGDGVGGVIREFADLTPMVEDLAKAAPKTAEEVQEFMEAKAGLVAILGGKAAGFSSLEPVIPHLGRLDPNIAKFSEVTQRQIERLENVPAIRKGAIGFRRFVNLVPKEKALDASKPGQAIEFFRQAALYALPRREVDHLVNAFAAADVEGRRTIYLGMMRTLGQKLGADEVPEVKEVFDRIIGSIEGTFKRPYALGVDGQDVSRVLREGAPSANLAVAEHQLTETWALPDFREIVRARREASLWRRLPGVGHIPDGIVDGFMDRIWKPLVLLRLGFPIRAGGEEVARQMLAEGFIPTIRARLGASTIKSWEVQRVAKYGRAFDFDQMGSSWKYIRNSIAEKTSWALSNVKTGIYAPLAGERYLHAAEIALLRHGSSMVPDNISSSRDVGGAIDRPERITKRLKSSRGREKVVRYKPGRGWKPYQQADEFQSQAWQDELARHMRSKSFRVYLENFEDPVKAEEALFNYLKSEEAAGIRKLSPRANAETMGLASQEQALREWARTMQRGYAGLIHDPTGAPVTRVIDALRGKVTAELVDLGHRGARNLSVKSAELLVGADDLSKVPTLGELNAIPVHQRPLAVAGREMLPVFASWWDGLIEQGFAPIGKMINWISRQPIYIHELAVALDEVAPLVAKLKQQGTKITREARKGGKFEVALDRVAEEWAVDLAAERVYRNIDNSELKSQFSVMHRNVFPFWHAQEQFIKRWSKTIARNPAVVRRAQLTMAGLRHSGAVHTDADGNDYFYYPGVMFSFGVLGKAANLVFGTNIQTGIPISMTGRIKFIAPGLESPRAALLPSPSPIVSVPMAFARGRFPTLRAALGDVEEIAFGSELAKERPVWEQLVPTSVARLYRTFFAKEEDDSQVASAMMQAVQTLEASGQGLAEDATAEDQESFQDRVEQTARMILGLRAIFGFAAPATPQVEFSSSLKEEFTTLIDQTGDINEATNRFIAQNPGATAWTVFTTEPTAKGIRVDPTAATADFIAQHSEFIRKYGGVAAHFIPEAPGKFDARAWRDQFAYGLRQRKDTETLWTDIKIADASSVYYPSKDAYEQTSAGLEGEALDLLTARWQTWQDAFFKMHPIFFREHIALAQQRDADRSQQLDQLSQALTDPSAPATGKEVGLVVESWRRYSAAVATLQGDRSSVAVARRAGMKQAFAQWGAGLTDIRAKAVFNSLIRPQLGL